MSSTFEGGVKSATQGQPLPTGRQAEPVEGAQSKELTKRVDYINFFC
jgi:hypothetical protein